MTYTQALATSWLLALALSIFACQAWAGTLYLDGGIGMTHFACTICSDDGTWVQTGLPHSMTMNSLAYRTGLDYRFDNRRWGIEAHYLNMGVSKIRQDYTVSDAQYDPKHHQCLAPCNNLGTFHTHDLMEGIELSFSHHWQFKMIEPFLRLGAAGMYHRLTAQQTPGITTTMHGWVPMTLIGAGLCTDTGLLCLETTYYRGVGGSTDWSAGLPLSKEALVSLASVKIALW